MSLWGRVLMLVRVVLVGVSHNGIVPISHVLLVPPDFSAMGTSRRYRNQGAGSMLMKTFIDTVDEKCLRAYVESTVTALSVYKKHGFEEVGRLRLDLEPWKTGNFFNICMIRPAQQKATESR